MQNYSQTNEFLSTVLQDDRDSIYFVGVKSGERFKEFKAKKANLVETITSCEGENIYVCINGFTSAMGARDRNNLRQINGIFVDVDCHDMEGEDLQIAIDMALCKLNQAVMAGDMLEPTMVVHSGRGIHLYYVYAQSIPARLKGGVPNAKGLKIHRYLTSVIYHSVRIAIADTALTIDEACSDLVRYVRVPGTSNTKAGSMCRIVKASNKVYTFDDLFGTAL